MTNKVLRSLGKAIKPVKRFLRSRRALAATTAPEYTPSPALPVIEVGDAFDISIDSLAGRGEAKFASFKSFGTSLDEIAREEVEFSDAPSPDHASHMFPPSSSISSLDIACAYDPFDSSSLLDWDVAYTCPSRDEGDDDRGSGPFSHHRSRERPSAPIPPSLLSLPRILLPPDFSSDNLHQGEDTLHPPRPPAPSPPSVLSLINSVLSFCSETDSDESSLGECINPRLDFYSQPHPAPPSTPESLATFAMDSPTNSYVEFVCYDSVAELAWDYQNKVEDLKEAVYEQTREICGLKSANAELATRLREIERLCNELLVLGSTTHGNSPHSSFDETLVSVHLPPQVSTVHLQCVSPKVYGQSDQPLNSSETTGSPFKTLHDLHVTTPRIEHTIPSFPATIYETSHAAVQLRSFA